jgi:hypothetical protein
MILREAPMLLHLFLMAVIAAMLHPAVVCAGRGVIASPHNLSLSGPNPTYAFNEIRVCVFCHTPHNAQKAAPAPLWNREIPSDSSYTMYESPNFLAKVGPRFNKPTGSSRVCLSCHDGTLALNQYGGRVLGSTGALTLLTGTANLSQNLTDDHPISFPFTTELAYNAYLTDPNLLTGAVKLDRNGFVQCTSCHDPHDNEFGNFLVMNNGDPGKPGYNPSVPSPLCVTCHSPSGWSTSVHNTGSGCMNCHTSHSAPVAQYLLKTSIGDTCFTDACHSSDPSHASLESLQVVSGSIRSIVTLVMNSILLAGEPDRIRRHRERGSDLKSVFNRHIYRHPIGRNHDRHNNNERGPLQRVHVECVDCHNVHMTGGPEISSRLKRSLKGVVGVSTATMTSAIATQESEICYKCHSGGNAGNFVGLHKVQRLIMDPDQMRRFSPSNPSIHPVDRNRTGRGDSLLDAFRSTMIRIECSDCHNSDESKKAGGSGPDGPHASRYEHILIARYEIPVGRVSNQNNCNGYRADFELCFRCHSDSYIMTNGTAFANGITNEHARHVIDRCIPCSACHDPHGVSAQAGATITNNSHLINFDRGFVAGMSVLIPQYQSLQSGRGSCTVNCHKVATRSYSH